QGGHPVIAAAAAAALSVQPFQYERPVRVDGSGVVEVVPDGPMYAHTRPGFADLRVLDEQGEQVAWREAPQPPALRRLPLVVLDRGRRGGAAVARVRTPVPVDRVTLVVPD